MIGRLRTFATPGRHPRESALSRYLEGDLNTSDRQTLQAHLEGCTRCRRRLASLETALYELGQLTEQAPAGLADSIIDALRAETPQTAAHTSSRGPAGSPILTVARAGDGPAGDRARSRWRRSTAAGIRWCLDKRQLRITLPIGLGAGVVLSLVNMGGMLMHGRIDLGVCVSCAMDFLVPFLALNLGLLLFLWLPRRGRPPA